MKAPDKLFLQPEVVFDAGNIEGHTSNSYDTVYIRKEALIEWLMDEMDRSEKFSTCEHYSNVIEHLEEM